MGLIPPPDDEDVIEIPLEEYEAIKAFAVKIAEQNTLVLESAKANAELVTAALNRQNEAIAEAFKQMSALLNIEIPPLPQPLITVSVPEIQMPKLDISLNLPPRKITAKVKRNKAGQIETMEGEIR